MSLFFLIAHGAQVDGGFVRHRDSEIEKVLLHEHASSARGSFFSLTNTLTRVSL